MAQTDSLPRAASPAVARPGPNRWAALAVGVLAISTASILIRLADAPPLVPGAFRTLAAALLLAPWGLPALRREWGGLTRRERWLLGVCGLLLGAHFAVWITSLSYTTVASSVILVTTNPLWVGLAGHWFLKERLTRTRVAAIAIALLGSAIISYGDLSLSGRALLGDLLALLGSLAVSAYMLLGRLLRRKLSTLAFAWPCYAVAGLLLALMCLLSGQDLAGLSARSYLFLALLALVPQVIGHTVVNWALAHVSPLVVTLAILGEPIGSTLLAIPLLHETPAPAALLGGVLILAGIVLATRQERRAAAVLPPSQDG